MSDVAWEAPAPGSWELDLAHCLGSMTPIVQQLQGEGFTNGMRELFATYGMPADTIDARFVNGFFYTRLRPLIGANRAATRLPPKPILKLAFALHPELRRRRRRAERALVERPWRDVIQRWNDHERAELEGENLALQDIDVGSLDEAGLARHFEEVLAAATRGYHRHFVLHGYDLGPIGLLLIRCEEWGIAGREVLPALLGASPSTSEPARILARLRGDIKRAGVRPASLEEVRAISPDIAEEVDRYLRFRGMRVFSRYDLDGVTVGELPEVVLATILSGAEEASTDEAELAAAAVRQRVPLDERSEFDDLLTEARFAMNLRDDNGPTTAEWRLGLLRRALLEVGRRLVSTGRAERAEDAFELDAKEVESLLVKGEGPTRQELSRRAELRRQLGRLTPPARLGPVEVDPPLDVLPAAQAKLLKAVRTVMTLLARTETDDGLSGTGIGTDTYRGPVRRAGTPEEAIRSIEPGDVLVVPFTTPAYNAVLPLAGALVTSQGGPLCHAAVLARELGIPAVVGVADALDRLEDGAEVEVDPIEGQVRLAAP